MLRYLTKKRKKERREKNHDAVKEIYKRGAGIVPAESLAVHRKAEKESTDRVIAAAAERRKRRAQKRSKSSIPVDTQLLSV